jgi:hypothetical protein
MIFNKDQQLINIYCICLQERDDRYQHITTEFRNIGILENVTFYRPYKHPKGGIYGNFESIMWCLNDSLRKNPNRPIAIFEDDIFFIKEQLSEFKLNMKFLLYPSKWDTIRLGYWKGIFIEQFDDNYYRGNCKSTHSMIWSPIFARKFIEDSTSIENRGLGDWYLAQVSGRHYLLKNTICYQRNGLNTDVIWTSKSLQSQFLMDPVKYQKDSQNRTHFIWKYIGSKIPMNMRGYVQMCFILRWKHIYNMIFRNREKYLFSNKCIL